MSKKVITVHPKLWELVFRTGLKCSGRKTIDFIFSKDYDRLKSRVNYFTKNYEVIKRKGGNSK